MSLAERDFIKRVDEAILKASPDELKKMQTLDLESQLKGGTFYDTLIKSNHKSKHLFASKTQTINKKRKN